MTKRSVQVPKEKGLRMQGIKIRKNAIVKEDTERAESVLEFQKYGHIAGKKCNSMVKDGQKKVFSRR